MIIPTSDPLQGNEEERDAEGNLIMFEATAHIETQEETETDRDIIPFITPECVEQIEREKELKRKL